MSKPTAGMEGVKRMEEVKTKRLFITEEGLKQLELYKYKAGEYTPLDLFLTTFWWNPISSVLPLWIAPNLVTLIGMGGLIAGYGCISYYSPTYSEEAPSWAYFACAGGIFFYQTMDAIDGKQARRTGSSSPLGQLFDHGCDCVSTLFIALSAAASVQLGGSWKTLVLLLFVQVPFFLAQWEEYWTHVFRTASGPLGVSEGQLMNIVTHLVSAILGPQVWRKEVISGSGFLISDAMLLGTCVMTSSLSLQCLWGTFKKAEDKWTAFLQLVPIILMSGCGALWCQLPDFDHPRLVFLTIGLTFSYLTNYMILCAVTKMNYPLNPHSLASCRQSILFPLPVVFLVSYLDLLPRHRDVVLGALFGFVCFKQMEFVTEVIEELTTYLNICAFSLKKRHKSD